MDTISHILQAPWAQGIGWTLGAIGWIVGLAAAIVQFRSYIDQRRTQRGFEQLLSKATVDWQGQYTQEQITALQAELSHLQATINTDLPVQAKQIFLRDQMASLAANLADIYARYESLSAQLDASASAPSPLPASIRDAIESAIMPTYLIRQKRDNRIYSLLILTIVLLVLFTSPLSHFVSFTLSVFLDRVFDRYVRALSACALAFLLALLIHKFKGKALGARLNAKPAMWMVIAICCLGVGGSWIWLFQGGRVQPNAMALSGMVAVTGLGVLLSVSLLLLLLRNQTLGTRLYSTVHHVRHLAGTVKAQFTPRRIFWAVITVVLCGVLVQAVVTIQQIKAAAHRAENERRQAQKKREQSLAVLADIASHHPSDVTEALRVVMADVDVDRNYVTRCLRAHGRMADLFEAGPGEGSDRLWADRVLATADAILQASNGNINIDTLGAMIWALDYQSAICPPCLGRAQQLRSMAVDILHRQRGWPPWEQFAWVHIPGGQFTMQIDEPLFIGDTPLQKYRLSDFYILSSEVTVAQYSQFDPAGRPTQQYPDADSRPMVAVSWYEAYVYAAWLGGRLPTEVEWEYACRANAGTRFSSGSLEKDLSAEGWYLKNSGGRLRQVGLLKANSWGLRDMHGNAWEWVFDWYTQTPFRFEGGFWGPSSGVARAIRGGGIFDTAGWATSSSRCGSRPQWAAKDRGFRVMSNTPRLR
jgi:formylglycine-generating enzyme required for sulfatase activity